MKIIQSNSEDLNTWLNELQEFQLDSIFETTILGRAYDYVSKVQLIESHQNKIACQISGTSIYEVKLEMVGNEIFCDCTCPYDQKCKHMAAVIISRMNIDLIKI